MKRILLLALLSAPIVASEQSKAMEGSAQVQAAKAKREMLAAIEASKVTYKQETEIQAVKQEQQVVETIKKPDIAQPMPMPKKSWFRSKWLYLAGISIVGAAACWYFRNNINTHFKHLLGTK